MFVRVCESVCVLLAAGGAIATFCELACRFVQGPGLVLIDSEQKKPNQTNEASRDASYLVDVYIHDCIVTLCRCVFI